MSQIYINLKKIFWRLKSSFIYLPPFFLNKAFIPEIPK